MFASYRRLFAAPGALAFTLTGLFARLSFAMTGVSTVVLIATRRDSYALAGAVSATGVVAIAVGLPLIGRLVDRYGQARVSVGAVLLAAWPTAGLLLCAHFGAPAWTLFVCCATSSVLPSLGGMTRARWAHLHRDDPAARHAANSLEQALDELCFMGGPVFAMLLCTSLFPEAGLLAGAVLGSAGLLLFAAQRRTEPPVQPPAAGPERGALRDGGLRVLVLVFAATGVVFGSMEVTTIAYADALGQKPLAGGLLALVAAGSCVSGLVLGLVRGRVGTTGRLLLGVAAMTVLLLLPLAAGVSGAGLGLLGAALFVAGSGTAPTMVAGMTMVQEVLPERQLNEGMGVAVAGILVGISTGAALGGVVAQQAAPGTGFLVPAGAAGVALLTALAGRRRLRVRPAPQVSALAA
ncbi:MULTISPECIES: MFS transporter [unclassified Kitasatospora]|uniref:MFS transporter n=1 Tax=unclassified Kitasatospora TaxID=2633591 RepID=UPI0007C74E74|nr:MULTISPECIES: MFS transporter [unclassified Kitasatospora]